MSDPRAENPYPTPEFVAGTVLPNRAGDLAVNNARAVHRAWDDGFAAGRRAALVSPRAPEGADARPPSAAEVLDDLRERLAERSDLLTTQADEALGIRRGDRLRAKAEGVGLALSFVDEARRALPEAPPDSDEVPYCTDENGDRYYYAALPEAPR